MSSFFVPAGKSVVGSSNLQSISVINSKVENQFIESVTIGNLLVEDLAATTITTDTINGIFPQAHAPRHTFDGQDPLDPAVQSDITELSDYFPTAGTNQTRIPRADHRHAHGNRGGGLLHAEATDSLAGFMSAADKTKLDSLPMSVLGTANQIDITPSNSDLIISMSDNPILPGTGSVTLPKGTNAQRSGQAGSIRFNTQANIFETSTDGLNWDAIQTSSTGVLSVSGTFDRIDVSPTTMNCVVDISASYVGQNSITTVGTLTSGSIGSGFNIISETVGGTGQSSYVLGDILYSSGTDLLSKLDGNTTISKQYLSQTGDGVNSAAPIWSTISGSDVTGSALTKTDDTNVTLTLGGIPSTALLHPTSITAGWTGVLSGSRGGTGVANSGKTITLGGNLTTSGTFDTTLTTTGLTSVTLPTSGTLATTSQLPTPAALTKTDDTNVTLTLGWTPASALLQAASITAGWTGLLSGSRGGTGVNNGTKTITLGGNFTTSGAFDTTFTMTGATSITLPTSGTLATTSQIPSVTPSALTKTDDTNVTLTLGGTPASALLQATSITAGWTGVLSGTRGGTGVNNGTKTITLGGNLATSGAFDTTLTATGPTSLTLPTSGTLATTSQIPSVTPSALTKVDDTNVTLTLGGTPASALLQTTSITAGWTGILSGARGGTGVANTGKTITLGGNLTTSGAFDSTFTMTNTTAVTFPTSGTLATTSQIPAITPSALTKTDDTNVTLTLGGTPASALLQATSITAGWTGTLSGARGGTGVANTGKTITLGGNLTTSGAFDTTLTATGLTSVTLPTSGTLATTSQLPTPAALTKVDDTNVTLILGGTPSTALLQAASITAGWTGTLSGTRGGTGVNNGTKTITLGGNLTTSGAFDSTFTMTGLTAVTFPTSGTLATTSQIPSVTPAALTKTDDTNVTLTLGGTPSTALLQATSITAGWTGTLGVARGGTGSGSAPTNGQLLIGNGTGYSLSTLSSTNGIAITNGSGTSSIGFTSTSTSVLVTYLVVAGGGAGGGGTGGGGGAGGVISSSQTITTTTLSITVGAGQVYGAGIRGDNSSITGTGFTSATAIGGGMGGLQGNGGSSGGSGGGGTSTNKAGGAGTAGQGNAGGNGSTFVAGAGGGGAGAPGAATTSGSGTNGGAGISSSITGSAVTYGGGGGGSGSSVSGSGGSGGGGAGSSASNGTSGTANTGGGGGGAFSISFNGGNGGSGIVILRIPTTYFQSFTGTATTTTVGTDTVVSFTAGTGTLTLGFNPGGVSIPNALNIAGATTIYDATASTSTTTGSLVTSGGVGMLGNLNVGGYITQASPQYATYVLPSDQTITTATTSYINFTSVYAGSQGSNFTATTIAANQYGIKMNFTGLISIYGSVLSQTGANAGTYECWIEINQSGNAGGSRVTDTITYTTGSSFATSYVVVPFISVNLNDYVIILMYQTTSVNTTIKSTTYSKLTINRIA